MTIFVIMAHGSKKFLLEIEKILSIKREKLQTSAKFIWESEKNKQNLIRREDFYTSFCIIFGH